MVPAPGFERVPVAPRTGAWNFEKLAKPDRLLFFRLTFVPPPHGAWIENRVNGGKRIFNPGTVRPPQRGGGFETPSLACGVILARSALSPPARGVGL